MNASSITLPRLTIYASAIGTVVLLCVAPFALPRVSPPEMQTSIGKPAISAASNAPPLLAGRRAKPSAAHRKTVHIIAPETAALTDAPATPLNE